MNSEWEASFRENRRGIAERMSGAAHRAGRSPEDVRLMAVTKTFPSEVIEAALRIGITLFGENRVQEARDKYSLRKGELELHLIGHLQRNKAKSAAEIADWVDSIDKVETAAALESEAAKRQRLINVLLEYNSSGEETKFGVGGADELWRLVDGCLKMRHLSIRGLMTIGPLTAERSRICRAFEKTRRLFEETRERYPDLPIDTLSMGMSGDFEAAIEEGSNMIRIGSALFGSRRPG